MTTTTTLQPNAPADPYCGNCGYTLTGLTDSSKCPECGRPIVEVLTRGPRYLEAGKRYRSATTLFGLPVIDIAIGPKHGELRGRARGIIAIGDIATGWLAIGGFARGIVAIGGFALGVFALGGGSVGLLSAMGGMAMSLGLAVGGLAIGGIASGGLAIGWIANGGLAIGFFARGGEAHGVHIINRSGATSTKAVQMFGFLTWLVGSARGNVVRAFQAPFYALASVLAPGALIALLAALATRNKSQTDQASSATSANAGRPAPVRSGPGSQGTPAQGPTALRP